MQREGWSALSIPKSKAAVLRCQALFVVGDRGSGIGSRKSPCLGRARCRPPPPNTHDSSALARSNSLTAGGNHLHLISEGVGGAARAPVPLVARSHLPTLSANP